MILSQGEKNMSRFLEIPSFATDPASLHKEALFYTLNGFLSESKNLMDSPEYPERPFKGKERELIQLLIDNSDYKLRMYGSAEELLENINIYKCFPGNMKLFQTVVELYQNRPRIFPSMKDEKYIAKSDMFVILQNMAIEIGNSKFSDLPAILGCYVKSRMAKIENSIEFVKFDEERFEKLYKRMKERISLAENQATPAEFEQLVTEFSKLNESEAIEKFKRLVPSRMERIYLLENIVKLKFRSTRKEYTSAELTAVFFLHCNIHTSVLEAIISENPDLFLPRGEDSEAPVTLRVFEDGDRKFLMKSEIFNTKSKEPFILETITMEELFKNHEILTRNVEFIRYPITRAKHKATPIQTPSGGFCILAIDYFFEVMRELTHGKKAFQKLKSADVPQFLENAFGDIFFLTESPYFIEYHRTFLGNQHNLNVPAKDVRNAKKDGFTLQNLKNELAHLGLTTTFPEIQDYAEVVYAEVDKRKKGSVLRTCDLFDAVEQCQLICVLEILPKLKKFVHNQRGCHRVYGFKCEDCAAENSKNQKDQKLKILEKELENSKIAHQKILEENQQKSLEIQELQQKNLRLSVKNETNEVKMKQLTEKLAQSKLSIDYGTVCTSNASQLKIQCLICEKSIESGEDQVIRCPLCKRRFHSKCAINWLKDHKECPACNGELPTL
ncbi:hypothetical protein B9Z55_004357 [Caenorhabditis nigoni]|uniref:RING-type domain-containing protein n=1 Tax=Caenorhabditis nigoni TaxID=1611254 RepID=A0A2G5UW48_9PELO|nr:hypothetical protein B9Z55_004357 [Caenorhabditis nigoni]